MLKTVTFTEQSNTKSGSVMLLGGFDGLHVGHKRLVERAKTYGLPVGVMTIVGGKSSENLFTLKEREEIFKSAGIDFAFELPFSEIKELSPERFVGLLIEQFSPTAFICGDDFRFGKNACGTAQSLKDRGQVRVEIVDLVRVDGEKISSTTVKRRLAQGDVERASELLGEPFFLTGTVETGRKIGRTLQFPTANIVYPKEKFPLKVGVYETSVGLDGKQYRAITNYGSRPTFGDDTLLTETYIDGFSGDLYGKELKISFKRYLRETQKFENAQALAKQLQEDIRRVREHD